MTKVLKPAYKVECNDVVAINGRFGETYLNPYGNMVVDRKIIGDEVILTISGWDGDFELHYKWYDYVTVKA